MAASATCGKSPSSGQFDLKDKKLVLERCQERARQQQKQLEEERVFFEAYGFNHFIGKMHISYFDL